MLEVAIIAFILIGVYKLIDRNKPENDDPKIDWWVALAFVFSPLLLIFFINIGVSALELSPFIVLVAYSLYFIIPYFYLKSMLDYSPRDSFRYAAWVPVVVIVVEIPLGLLFGVFL